MTNKQRNWRTFFGAIAATSLVCGGYLAIAGTSDEYLRIVLRLSARAALLVLLLVFVARPLQQLFHTAQTARLLRNRRLLGIAFAGIHTAHLGFILLRARLIQDFEFSPAANLPGMLAYVVILLMFASSFDSTTRLLGPRYWRLLHKSGLYVLFAAFTQTQLPEPGQALTDLNWPLLFLIAAALVIRLTAWLAQRQRRSTA